MKTRFFDHLDLRVSNLEQARRFYDVFLPAAGLTEVESFAGSINYRASGDEGSSAFVGINEEPYHCGNANRLALWAETEEEVNRLGQAARGAGARAMEGPAYCPDYKPGYYAVFFEDLDGNRWEICCRTARVR